jgi:serine/threonine-protein kinase
MSPEQAAGRMSAIGPPSNIYSMGVILYQLFTGSLPFVADSFAELLVAHATQRPPPLRTLAPDLDERLEHIVLRCLEKDPEARFSTVVALRRALAEPIPGVVASARSGSSARATDPGAAAAGAAARRPRALTPSARRHVLARVPLADYPVTK